MTPSTAASPPTRINHLATMTSSRHASATISSPRDDAWIGLAIDELLEGLEMGHRPQPPLLAPLRVAGGRGQIPSAEQLDVPPDHRFGPIRVDTTPPRPRPPEATTPADQGKPQLADQRPPPLVPLRTIPPPSTQATQWQAPGGKPSPREAPRAAGPSMRPHTGRVSATPTGSQGQPPRAAPRAAGTSTRPHTGRATTTPVGHITSSPRAAPDSDGEVEAALRECLGDLPPDVLEEMAHGAEDWSMEGLFGESPDEDGAELPMRPAPAQSIDEPRTPSPQFLPDYEEISSDEGAADEVIQISDSDDAEPAFRPPSTPPPGPYHTGRPLMSCAAATPNRSTPTTSGGYAAAVAPRRAEGPSTSRSFASTADEDSADERPAVAAPRRPPLPTPGECAAAVARRRAEDLSDELGSSSAGPTRPNDPEPRSARDRSPTPAPARRGRRRSAPWANSPSASSSEEESPRDRQGHTRWVPAPDGWSTPNGTLPAGLIRRIQQRLQIARARRYLEEEQGQRFRV
nr:nascent polypeptide-associated complex subunit alpha, muscle-specific form-like [Drosophila kikkawai]